MSKEESTVPSTPAPPKPAPPKAPAKPAAAAAKPAVPRRSFLSWMTLAWTAFTASMLAAVTATARFMFPNVLFEPPPTFKAGYPNEIQVGQVDERFKQKFAIWLVRTAYDQYANATGIFALSTVCTHLGCTPNWLEAEQKFKCPCHGSGYYKTGVNFEGPTPRPLERFAISLADDGQILVDKSRKFQQEKGEWSNPAAFLKL
ncbi:MAG: Rieske (2Fe-2S) protein [Acidobacteria bacterium]|nr:MAG: Rieske (2Fe-2S) protein [Acidobacteriota bacterium]